MCCGQGRRQLRMDRGGARRSDPARPAPPQPGPMAFEYVGTSSLALVGPYSGREYRFPGPGAQGVVEPVDQAYLAGIRALRQVMPAGRVKHE